MADSYFAIQRFVVDGEDHNDLVLATKYKSTICKLVLVEYESIAGHGCSILIFKSTHPSCCMAKWFLIGGQRLNCHAMPGRSRLVVRWSNTGETEQDYSGHCLLSYHRISGVGHWLIHEAITVWI